MSIPKMTIYNKLDKYPWTYFSTRLGLSKGKSAKQLKSQLKHALNVKINELELEYASVIEELEKL